MKGNGARTDTVTPRTSLSAQRAALELELEHMQRSAPFPTPASIAAHSMTVAALEAKLTALPQSPATGHTGAQAGSVILHDTRMGTGFHTPEDCASDDSRHESEYDPHLREFGSAIR